MGFYISGPAKGKGEVMVKRYGAVRIPTPLSMDDVPAGKALVCVVDNGPFEAAGYCYNPREFECFTNPRDMRLKSWYLMEEALTKKLSEYHQ